MRVAVFGSTGMLGRYVSTYLSAFDSYSIREINRKDIDLSDFDEYVKIPGLIEDCDVVINCAGTIKPVAKSQEKSRTFMVNSVFPHFLARKRNGRKMYHITTDCVYDGIEGSYNELSEPNMFDDYGFSKSIGDLVGKDCVVFRTSIIGEELENKRSLVEWAKSQKGKEVNGYTNHYWNGVTCLEMAHILQRCLPFFPLKGVYHIHSDTVTKYQLLQIISDEFNLNLKVIPTEGPELCNRTLTTTHPFFPINRDIRTQIKEMVGYFE